MEDETVVAARRGTSSDSNERVTLEFAQAIIRDRGQVADEEIDRLRHAGFNDGEMCEIIANVALNVFTNDFNHIASTEIDFPPAPDLAST